MAKKAIDPIINKLSSDVPQDIIAGIDEFAKDGQAKHIPMLIALLNSSIEEEVLSRISSVLGQLKKQEAVPYLIDAIKDENYADIRQALLVACWENGLNYTEYLDLFVDIMLSADFMIMLEAHTVVTNMTGKISAEDRETIQDKIAGSITNIAEDKQAMLSEVSEFLYALEDGIEPMSV